MWKLAFRNIFRHRLRSGITLAAIGFGVAAMIVAGGFVEDLYARMREATIRSQLGHLQVHRAGFTRDGGKNPKQYLLEDVARTVGTIKENGNVQEVMARLGFGGLLNNGKSDYSIVGDGVEPEKEAVFSDMITIIEGRQLTSRDRYGILVGAGVASAMKLKAGDLVSLLVSTFDGAVNSLEFEVVGVIQTLAKDYDDRVVRIQLAAAQELLGTDAASTLVVMLRDTAATATVKTALAQRLGAGRYEIVPWYELADFYNSLVALYDRYLGVLQFIIAMMVLLSVVNSVNMTLFERTGEFGTLMALGNRPATVFRLIVAESFLLGLIGALAGVVAGIVLALLISLIGIPMPPAPGSNVAITAAVHVVPEVIARAAAIGFVATMIAALLPARRVARLVPAEALRYNY